MIFDPTIPPIPQPPSGDPQPPSRATWIIIGAFTVLMIAETVFFLR